MRNHVNAQDFFASFVRYEGSIKEITLNNVLIKTKSCIQSVLFSICLGTPWPHEWETHQKNT